MFDKGERNMESALSVVQQRDLSSISGEVISGGSNDETVLAVGYRFRFVQFAARAVRSVPSPATKRWMGGSWRCRIA